MLIVGRIGDDERLARIAAEAGHQDVRKKARALLRTRQDRAVAKTARRIVEDRVADSDVAALDDPAVLADLVIRLSEIYGRPWTTFRCRSQDVCAHALDRLVAIGTPIELAEVVKNATGYDVQTGALRADLDADLLAEIEAHLGPVEIHLEFITAAPM